MNLLKQYNEKDNIFEKVYHFMWAKDESFIESKSSIRINLPHTILFDHGQPLFWYFSDKNKRLRKKRRENILFEEIERLYLKDVQDGEVVAYFIHRDSQEKGGGGPSKKGPLIQYYLKEEFLTFIRDNFDKFPTGILQKFVKPLSDKNTLIQVNWSQKLSIITKKKNNKDYRNHKIDPYERCCTFDGPEFFSESVGVKGVIGSELNDICNSIVQHIQGLSFDQINITRMLFFFKQDQEGTPWFLWASSLRLESRIRKNFDSGLKNLNNTPLGFKKLEIPSNVESLATINLQRPLKLVRDIVCLNCSKKGSEDQFAEITYQYVIQAREELSQREMNEEGAISDRAVPIIIKNKANSFKKQTNLLSKSSKNIIPSVIETLHPKITADVYLQIKNEFEFQNRKILVCYDCFYNIVKAKKTSGGLQVDWNSLKENYQHKFKSLDKSEGLKKIVEQYKNMETNFLKKILSKRKWKQKEPNDIGASDSEKPIPKKSQTPTNVFRRKKPMIISSSSENSFEDNLNSNFSRDKKLVSSVSEQQLKSNRLFTSQGKNRKFQYLLSSVSSHFESKMETENSENIENSKLSKLFSSNYKTTKDLINESAKATATSTNPGFIDQSPSARKPFREKSPYETATGRVFSSLKKNIELKPNKNFRDKETSKNKTENQLADALRRIKGEKYKPGARSAERGSRRINAFAAGSGVSEKVNNPKNKFDFSNLQIQSPYLTLE